MRKIITITLVAVIISNLVACNTNNIDINNDAENSQITTEQELESIDFDNAEFAVSNDGEVLIEVSSSSTDFTSNEVDNKVENKVENKKEKKVENKVENKVESKPNSFTLPDEVIMDDEALGVLYIPKINLEVPIYETDDEMEAMVNGIAHFKETSCWDGNVGLAGHNQGINEFFGKLHKLVPGDTVKLKTSLGERNYKVVKSFEISETDWSVLDRSEENMITMITCVNHDLTKRLCVQAKEI